MRRKDILKLLWLFLATFFVTASVLWFFRFPSIKGESMEPTRHDGDVVLVLHMKIASFGDEIILWSSKLDEYIVKRVIGVAGDVVEIKDGNLMRNGVTLYESYVKDQGWAQDLPDQKWEVGQGELFLLGDNRLNSKDSRELGMFGTSDIFGLVLSR